MATLAISLVGQAAGLISGLLGQHSLRLKDAQSENDAAQKAVVAFDSDLQEIASGFNSGQVSQDDAFAALANVDATIMQYLQAQVGKPGTAWNLTQPCTKACTVGCCIYSADLHPSIINMEKAIQAGGGSARIYHVFGSKYGIQDRPGYSINLSAPAVSLSSPGAAVTSVASSILSAGRSIESVFTGGRSVASSSNALLPPQKSNPLIWLLVGIATLFVFVFLVRK